MCNFCTLKECHMIMNCGVNHGIYIIIQSTSESEGEEYWSRWQCTDHEIPS